MAQFRVGQRVKVLPTQRSPWSDEGTVTGICPDDPMGHTVLVRCDNHPTFDEWDAWFCHPDDVRPITDPGADAFIERVKKLKPYDEPKVERYQREYEEALSDAMNHPRIPSGQKRVHD
jgi:hypothetical protein